VAAKIVDTNSALDDDFNSFASKSYTDVFPGVNAKFAFSDKLLMRAAVTTAIGRPNYPALAPYVIAEGDTPADSISLGNPDLKPYRALNFDASLESYPTQDSLFSAGIFHKQIDNPIYPTTRREANMTYGGVTYALADVDQLVNFDTEYLTGVEFNAQTQFTGLPGVLGGFGISASYAHIWGHADAAAYRAGKIPLAFQSKDVANVQLFFEKYGLVARLAFNYRSSYLDAVTDDAATDQFTDGNGQLDLHVSYQFTPQFTVFGDAINLTDAPWRRYIGDKDLLIEREHYGTQLRGGVQLHF
jgi:TonB-dependent receptor